MYVETIIKTKKETKMIKHNDQKQTAKQYIKGRFWECIVTLMDCNFESDEEIMNDENFVDAFYFLHTEPNDLRRMTLRERKEVIRQLHIQGERLAKIVR